jgi:hypothetical protein
VVAVEEGSTPDDDRDVDEDDDDEISDETDTGDGAVTFAAAAESEEVAVAGGGEERGAASSASVERMSTSVSAEPPSRAWSGPLSRGRFPAEEEDGVREGSGAGRRACDAMLQSSAEADEEATKGIADDEEEEEGADAGAVGFPEEPSRRGM